MLNRDGTLGAGVLAGVLFALEFLLIYRGLVWTTATRAVLFLYLAPFFVVIGSRWLIPGDRFHLSQWLEPSFPSSALSLPSACRRPLPIRIRCSATLCWWAAARLGGQRRLVIKASALNRVGAEKTLLYQLVISAPLLAVGAIVFGEHIDRMPSAVALGAFAYQTIWVVSVTFAVWFALIVRYSAARLSAFTFLAPLFGVAGGHLVLNEPLTPAFVVAAALVALGLVLVNRPR